MRAEKLVGRIVMRRPIPGYDKAFTQFSAELVKIENGIMYLKYEDHPLMMHYSGTWFDDNWIDCGPSLCSIIKEVLLALQS
jgi:hypothetical protein